MGIYNNMIEDRILRRADVARLLNVSPRTVDAMAAQGLITKLYFPTRKRASGFSQQEIAKVLASLISKESENKKEGEKKQ